MQAHEKELEYPDFSRLFSNKKEIRKAKEQSKVNVKINGLHYMIYMVALILSILLLIPYLMNEKEAIYVILMSVGAGGIGASILGCFIEIVFRKIERDKKIKRYNDYVWKVYTDMWQVFGNRSYEYLKKVKVNNGQETLAQQIADEFILQLQIVLNSIEVFSVENASLLDDYAFKFYFSLKTQIVKFIASLRNPTDINHLIITIDGVRIWLRTYFDLKKVKKLFIR